MVDTSIRKIFEQLFIPLSSDTRRLQGADINKPLKKFFKVYCVYLLRLCNMPIIMLLTNNITKTWREISKIRMIL